MSDQITLCRLVGGRYDGDEGTLTGHLPAVVWAGPCGLVPPCSTQVHWHHEPGPQRVRYDQAGTADDGAQLYVYDRIAEWPTDGRALVGLPQMVPA